MKKSIELKDEFSEISQNIRPKKKRQKCEKKIRKLKDLLKGFNNWLMVVPEKINLPKGVGRKN